MGTELAERKTLIDEAMDLVVHETRSGGDHLKALLDTRSVLFPIEKHAEERLSTMIEETRQDVFQNQHRLPRLSFEPLSWRHPSGLPKLVVMPLASPTITFYASISNGGHPTEGIAPQLPEPVALCYADVLKLAAEQIWRSRSEMKYSFTFEGVIPTATRVAIGEAIRSRTFDDILLVVETPETAWKVERTKGITRRQAVREALADFSLDPIVVGFAQDALWVIDKFDLTDVERYVADEFTRRELPALPPA